MQELGIALAGVLVGALVTEGLRVWRGHVDTKRRLRGALRLVRSELINNAISLTGDQSSPAEIRARIASGVLSVDQWKTHELLLAESLSERDWSEIANVNLVFSKLMVDLDLTSDEDLAEIADHVARRMERARGHIEDLGF